MDENKKNAISKEDVDKAISRTFEIFNEALQELKFVDNEDRTIKKLGFTGHRSKAFSFGYNESGNEYQFIRMNLMYEMLYLIKTEMFNYFICGGAEGADMWFAETVLVLKNIFPKLNIKLEIAMPFEGYCCRWSKVQIQRLDDIVRKADKAHYITDVAEKGSYQERNQYIVEQSDAMLAMFNSSTRRTKNMLEYAKKIKKTCYYTVVPL